MTVIQFPECKFHKLGEDILNGNVMAGLISNNPESIKALFIMPGQSHKAGDSEGQMFSYGAGCKAKNFTAEAASQVLSRHPEYECKYYMFGLGIVDPQFPIRCDLILGEVRWLYLEKLASGKGLDKSMEGELVLATVLEKSPEARIVFVDSGDVFGNHSLIEKELLHLAQYELVHSLDTESTYYDELTFEY